MLRLVWLALLVPTGADDPAEIAQRFLQQCREGQFAQAFESFDPTMSQVMPSEKLEQVWKEVVGSLGPIQEMGEPELTDKPPYTLVTIRCEFEKRPLNAQVTIDEEGQISGFFLRPALPTVEQAPPPYVDRDRFEEVEVTVGAEGWPLPGTLSRPKGVAATPLVILVHGSGPHDRDESIGPNAPFRDLAWGLASKGIATLRFEKRTHAHQAKLADATTINVDAEVVDDALAAINAARTFEGIDPDRIYLLGHSLGGMMAPEIARRDGKLAGIILLAASARPLDEVILDQLRYLASMEEDPDGPTHQALQESESVISRYRAGEAELEETILGAPLAYWATVFPVRPAEAARELGDLPMLIIQGGRDYQVTDTDFERFREALGDRPHVSFERFEDLNHLFQPGQGKGTPEEYARPGHVDARVIDRIADWVQPE